jgi:hypothetical protein
MKPLSAMTKGERKLFIERVGVAIEDLLPPGCVYAVVVVEDATGSAQVTTNVPTVAGTRRLFRDAHEITLGPAGRLDRRRN